jgi:hypothetical protein
LPPQDSKRPRGQKSVPQRRSADTHAEPAEEVASPDQFVGDEDDVEIPGEEEVAQEPLEKSIRNIAAPSRRPRDEIRDVPRFSPPIHKPKRSYRVWLWAIAAAAVIALGALLLVALRGTSVNVVPRSHAVVFDETSRFTAYPQTTSASGTLAYTTEVLELQDSEAVQSSGVVHVEERASGVITVFNDSSSAPYRLIKNTRFESAGGLIFRAPADVVIPGKSGSTPGSVSISVMADQVGEQYNIAPGKLTVPGLKGGADFTKVYAQANAAFTGGFSGDRPGVSEVDMESARTAVRGRLEKKIYEAIEALSDDASLAFPQLATVTYEDMPIEDAGEGNARVQQKVVATAVVLPMAQLANTVARTVSADADNSTIRIVGIKDFGALPVNASTTVGTDPLQFALTGQAMLVWEVDASELAQALAGRDQSAFQTIVTGFSGIQSATARIEPFWSDSFPSEAARIRVKIEDPASQ